jgi:cytochrome c1
MPKKLTPLQKYIREQKKAVQIADQKEARDRIALKKKMEKLVAQGIANREKQDKADRDKKKQRISNIGNYIMSAGASHQKQRKKKGKFKFFVVF